MRLFVAVDPAAEAVEHLRAALPPDAPGLRWGEPARWHVTLVFLGDVGADKLAELTERLDRAARRTAPMTLALKGSGRFSQALWIGVRGDVVALRRLADRVGAAARRCGVPVEERRFRPHLTVARSHGRADLRPPVGALSTYDGPPWIAADFHLVRSYLGSAVRHERLATWPLRCN